MIRSATLVLLFFTSFQLVAWQQGGELVYTATMHLEKAQAFTEAQNYDSALVYCTRAFDKAPSYREVYIVRHKVYEAMGESSALKIENLKAGQKVSKEDEELSYYLAQIYQKDTLQVEAIAAYTQAIEYNKANDGELQFLYYYYIGRGTSYLKDKAYEQAITDFDSALEIKPESTGALINRGFCYYNSKNKENACADWCKASKLGNAAAGNYITKYCF